MTTQRAVLKPGILVSLKTSIRGGVAYERKDLEKERIDETTQAKVARWETTKRVEDPVEYEKATKTRNEARSLIARACAHTAFGLLCAVTNEEALNQAIRAAEELCTEFNADANNCRIGVWVLKGRIAATDDEAARAIQSEVESLLAEMESGVKTLDTKAIRDAANRARKLEQVLGDDDAAKVTAAVDASRRAARAIVARIEKGGEEAEAVAKELKPDLSVIAGARFAFLESAEPGDDDEAQMPATEIKRFATLDRGEC